MDNKVLRTVAEIDDLPTRSVVMDGSGEVWRRAVTGLWDNLDTSGDPPLEESETILWQSTESGVRVLWLGSEDYKIPPPDALSSPPTDDVREALARVIWECDHHERAVLADCRGIAEVILADPRFEVRLRGTVTEPTEVKRAETSAGFAIWRIPNADYTGQPVRTITVQESSLATEFRVWLGYDDERRMHLTADAAREVREALTAWLREFGLDGVLGFLVVVELGIAVAVTR
uniref:hypothetical protein n=1 Tax=Microbacterium proteolyticum TaxID=1572644 RepID=UPI002417EB98|nr:hypothetical protein [Microbacterium proteolyticum]